MIQNEFNQLFFRIECFFFKKIQEMDEKSIVYLVSINSTYFYSDFNEYYVQDLKNFLQGEAEKAQKKFQCQQNKILCTFKSFFLETTNSLTSPYPGLVISSSNKCES